ncbi:hypothetical protein SK128_007202 [Halocaridina rubra]|uniref:Uncharacterized protein n=1 Tax=Halocaridina rubra TaxID=373956 RepID=A0AAN8X7D4_HALRR
MGNLTLKRYKSAPVTIKHQTAPLMLTFIWDPFLQLKQKLRMVWLSNKMNPPTLVLMGTALHWMRKNYDIYLENPEKAANIYKKSLLHIAPFLKRLAKTALVVFKLLDHLPEPYNVTNIDLYNAIAAEAMPKNVAIWDSIIPLSDMYVSECQKHPQDTPNSNFWRCSDFRHSGFIIIEKFVDMLLNYACNRHLSLDKEYCV